MEVPAPGAGPVVLQVAGFQAAAVPPAVVVLQGVGDYDAEFR